ncbi:hypothetical protein T11_13344 [Trichinella zimbabwensis]|uniref:Uncharacterized protein n=1 Tax=Trichinella zimbabwensis TaxID=268475 RepID=A0A0V1GQ35_9BILA|nr:hypothetical protein T11_13344 [Trichinella zimbabwensis]
MYNCRSWYINTCFCLAVPSFLLSHRLCVQANVDDNSTGLLSNHLTTLTPFVWSVTFVNAPLPFLRRVASSSRRESICQSILSYGSTAPYSTFFELNLELQKVEIVVKIYLMVLCAGSDSHDFNTTSYGLFAAVTSSVECLPSEVKKSHKKPDTPQRANTLKLDFWGFLAHIAVADSVLYME